MLQNDARQMWKKGETNDEGYFTLINPRSKKVLTALSAQSLGIGGMLKNSNVYTYTNNFLLHDFFLLTFRKLSEVQGCHKRTNC